MNKETNSSFLNSPDGRGYFGEFGGRFTPETLSHALDELTAAYEAAKNDPAFNEELNIILRDYVGRPSPLTYARRLTEHLGGARIYLKREDLLHTGAHKINNSIGQALLAKRMGKTRLIAETGAGQHGVATAAAAAYFGLPCVVYMGTEDMERQKLNVFRMRLMGTEVRPVEAGSRTLKDAVNEAMRDWVTNVEDTHYILGSVLGPHPFPVMVRDFQRVIGVEARDQIVKMAGQLPNVIVACVGGGSNSIGIFHEFLADEEIKLIGVEAGGEGIETGRHAARFTGDEGGLGVFQGTRSYVLQREDGNIQLTHSVSAGLDYPGVGPEHAFLRQEKRAEYTFITDEEALQGFRLLSELEGILPALESSHAIAHTLKIAPAMSADEVILVSLSGRGDKDVHTVAKVMGVEL